MAYDVDVVARAGGLLLIVGILVAGGVLALGALVVRSLL